MESTPQRSLGWPFGGLDEDLARANQRGNSSPDLVNVRGLDPNTGRERGGARSGIKKAATNQVNGSAAVRQIAVVDFDQRGSTFAQLADGSDVKAWAKATPLIKDCTAIGIDADRNRYVLDGRSGIAKFNADGALVWKFVLPIQSQEHVVRALVVDADGTFYAAVSSGHPQKDGRIWKFRPASGGQSVPNLEWTIEIAGYVEQLRLRQGVLYAACNFTDTGQSTVRAYRLIDTGVPELAYERDQVPNPVNGMAVRSKDGAIFTTHESNSKRALFLGSPDTGPRAEDWDPTRLDQFPQREWCVLDASDVDGDGTNNAAYTNGATVDTWVDASGNGRNAYDFETLNGGPVSNVTSPTLNKGKQFGGFDTVRFSNPGASIVSAHNALASGANNTTNNADGNGQVTLIPCYDDAWFTVLMVGRTSDFTNMRTPLAQIYAGGFYRTVTINADTTGGSAIAVNSGKAAFTQSVTGAGTAGPYASYDATTGFFVVCFTCKSDGSAVTTGTNAVNGNAVTNPTYAGFDLASTFNTQLGRWTSTIFGGTAVGGTVPFDGELAYMLVLRDYSDAGTKKICTAAEVQQLIGWAHWRFGVTANTTQFAAAATYSPFNASPFGPPVATDTVSSKSAYLFLTQKNQMLVKWDPNKLQARWVVNDSQSFAVSGANWTNATKTITQVGAFAGYVFTSGDKIALSAGTGVTVATYTVASKVSDDAITVTTDINGAGGNISDNSVVGVLFMGQDGIGGLGFAVEVTDDRVCVHGPSSANVTGTSAQIRTAQSHVRRVLDNGDTVSVTGASTWESKWTAEPDYHNPRMAMSGRAANNETDDGSADYLYVPVHATISPQPAAYVYLPSGNNAGTNTQTSPTRTIAASSGARGYACAVEAVIPEYVPGQTSSLSDQYLVIGTQHEGSDALVVVNVRLIGETRTNTDPRGVYVAATAGAALVRVADGGSLPSPTGAPTLQGGNYVSIVPAFQHLWIADSSGYYRLDPRLSDGVAATWASKTAGTLPRGGRILGYCFSRLLIARAFDAPDQLFATAIADPYDCDVSPPESNGSEAWAVPMGQPINALIPMSDDLLLVGLPDSIRRITGDPARGGTDDLVKEMGGVAFGEAWCKDPENAVYVFETRGSVSFITPTKTGSLTDARIRRRMEAIDPTQFFVRMAWNWKAQGVHVFVVPQGSAPASQSYGFFWEKRTGAWYYDEYPWWVTSCRSVDNANGRHVLIGCSDGYVRQFDETVDTDDGAAMRWRVVFPNVRAMTRVNRRLMGDDRSNVRVSRPRFTFAEVGQGCVAGLLASSENEFPSIPTTEWTLSRGLSEAAPIQARGANVWPRLRGTGAMAFEEGSCLVQDAGIRRLVP